MFKNCRLRFISKKENKFNKVVYYFKFKDEVDDMIKAVENKASPIWVNNGEPFLKVSENNIDGLIELPCRDYTCDINLCPYSMNDLNGYYAKLTKVKDSIKVLRPISKK